MKKILLVCALTLGLLLAGCSDKEEVKKDDEAKVSEEKEVKIDKEKLFNKVTLSKEIKFNSSKMNNALKYQGEFKNETGYNVKNLTINVDVYDKDGKLLETTNGSSYSMTFDYIVNKGESVIFDELIVFNNEEDLNKVNKIEYKVVDFEIAKKEIKEFKAENVKFNKDKYYSVEFDIKNEDDKDNMLLIKVKYLDKDKNIVGYGVEYSQEILEPKQKLKYEVVQSIEKEFANEIDSVEVKVYKY